MKIPMSSGGDSNQEDSVLGMLSIAHRRVQVGGRPMQDGFSRAGSEFLPKRGGWTFMTPAGSPLHLTVEEIR